MAQKTTRIVCDNDVLHGEPRLEGRRISVRQIADWVEAGNLSAQTVADRYDLDVADVYAALAHYHSHPDEMAALDRELQTKERQANDRGAVSLSTLREESR